MKADTLFELQLAHQRYKKENMQIKDVEECYSSFADSVLRVHTLSKEEAPKILSVIVYALELYEKIKSEDNIDGKNV